MLFVPYVPYRQKAIASFHHYSNTAAIHALLSGLREAYAAEPILVFADRAAWHQSKQLSTPANIHLKLLPPYSPELNATEHLWDYIQEQKGFTNPIFHSMDELEDHLEAVLKTSTNKKTTSDPYVPLTAC